MSFIDIDERPREFEAKVGGKFHVTIPEHVRGTFNINRNDRVVLRIMKIIRQPEEAPEE